jgi:hypothetical protein
MNQHDLLAALDKWPVGSTADTCHAAISEAVPLMKAAAAEIRRLSPQIEPLTDEESERVSELFEQLGNRGAGQ